MKRYKSEDGNAVIESIYVIFIALMMISFTINIAVIYHNRLVLTVVADEAANGVAEIYGSLEKEPFYNYTSRDYFWRRNIYRYLFGGRDKHRQITASKGKWYASYLLYENEFSSEHSMDFSDVIVSCGKNELGVDVVTVKIEREYPVFIMNPMSFWKLDPKYRIKVSGNAVCYDVIYQMNGYALVKEMQDKADSMLYITTIIDNCFDIIDKAHKLLTK